MQTVFVFVFYVYKITVALIVKPIFFSDNDNEDIQLFLLKKNEIFKENSSSTIKNKTKFCITNKKIFFVRFKYFQSNLFSN